MHLFHCARWGYHFDSVDGKNGDASFDRTFIDLLGFYHLGAHGFGIGMTHHFSPELELNIDDEADGTIKFDSADGLIVEYNYFVAANYAIGVRYTDIDYDIRGFDDSVDGSHFGIFIIGTF